ncbi:hypothetical protein [Paraburkholderia silvatlantica]|uniref:Uncharacterized protein n=1 Tax=Paraburkholderia silvatlantica TaxID=321895 RepID=A0ABR6FLP0_9BURK|nr:hypothetical protein [Paraburkholderia silvatlantica]MBB2928359.1 hypothetical protein [Paraburkholderia silvatlantica]PVY34595.1 hypothetical protein C7411_107131 [Paraburkholderia silvatlantica]PXW38810.1 hypothetical protein C7413_107131 [Paraburkholderia silvatlantica]
MKASHYFSQAPYWLFHTLVDDFGNEVDLLERARLEVSVMPAASAAMFIDSDREI